jgi:hypothetical protein
MASKAYYKRFCSERASIEKVQRKILKDLLTHSSLTPFGKSHQLHPRMSYEEVIRVLPVSKWGDWEELVETQRNSMGASTTIGRDVLRYQPTSGSTHKRKWIPYTKKFLSEIDQASLVWMHDLYRSYPKIQKGTHYWSLSWLPSDLRDSRSNDDLDYLPSFKKRFLRQVMAVPEGVQNTQCPNSSQFATMAWLLSQKNLSLVFVWSPTFFISMINEIMKNKSDLVMTLSTGSWAKYQKELKHLAAPKALKQSSILKNIQYSKDLASEMWKKLALVSCWSSADSSLWIETLKALTPHAEIQGKGLFATEGVVTIPVQGKLHLSYQSHFYEFKLDNGEVLPAWKLKTGMMASPLISSGNGLWRYELGDRVRVEEMIEGCPILSFQGRAQTVDLVGEKLTQQSAREVVEKINRDYPEAKAKLFLAMNKGLKGKPQYALVCESNHENMSLKSEVENALNSHHHYRLARELNQLECADVINVENCLEYYSKICTAFNWIQGDIKWEAITKIPHRVES